jgi:lipopolysaccharide/colanic/teichoic acid biosynthesis glycosyltransferase
MNAIVRGGTILLLVGDVVTFVGALILTLLVRYQAVPGGDILKEHLRPFLFIFAVWLLVFLIFGLYDRHVSLVRKRIPIVVMRAQLINILIAALIFFILPLGIAPKTNLIIYLFISTALIAVWRLYGFPLIAAGKPMTALVIGSSTEATEIARVLASNPFFKHIHAFLLSRTDISDFEEFQKSLHSFVEDEQVEIIIADMRDEYAARLTTDLYRLAFEDRNIRFFNLPSVYEQLHHRIPPDLIEETWLLENITAESPHYAYDFLKRIIDTVGALILFIPSLILLPLIALAIKLDDKGPIFYRAERVGQFNEPILLFKFRTMTGRDTGYEALHSKHEVTRVGAILRKTRLDELPQLINIIKGDLSFIGPRPEIPSLAFVYSENIPYYNMRHLIKPGLSGWAQILNFDVPRKGIDIERTVAKLSFDLYYLKHRSLLLDFEIALKTIDTLLMRTGT